jgi:serine/threonine protein kinase
MSITEVLQKKYQNITRIGEGAFGKVYAAEDLKTKNSVVLKVALLKHKTAEEAFSSECKHYFNLKHPNICRLYKYNTIKTEGKKYGVYVLEKLQMDLLNLIIATGGIKEKDAKCLFREICKGVEYCHSKGIAHLDIKPDNVLLEIEDENVLGVKLCDFGFAKKWNKKRNPTSSFIHRRGKKIGTLEYCAPELRYKENENDDDHHHSSSPSLSTVVFADKADIYSLGVVLFTIITATFPFIFDAKGNISHSLGVNHIKQYTNGKECFELLKLMLHDCPDVRPSVSEILAHPWLA